MEDKLDTMLDTIVVQIPAREVLELDAALESLALIRSQYGDDEGAATAMALKKRLTTRYQVAVERLKDHPERLEGKEAREGYYDSYEYLVLMASLLG